MVALKVQQSVPHAGGPWVPTGLQQVDAVDHDYRRRTHAGGRRHCRDKAQPEHTSRVHHAFELPHCSLIGAHYTKVGGVANK